MRAPGLPPIAVTQRHQPAHQRRVNPNNVTIIRKRQAAVITEFHISQVRMAASHLKRNLAAIWPNWGQGKAPTRPTQCPHTTHNHYISWVLWVSLDHAGSHLIDVWGPRLLPFGRLAIHSPVCLACLVFLPLASQTHQCGNSIHVNVAGVMTLIPLLTLPAASFGVSTSLTPSPPRATTRPMAAQSPEPTFKSEMQRLRKLKRDGSSPCRMGAPTEEELPAKKRRLRTKQSEINTW